MKKLYTAFVISLDTEILRDLGWGRYSLEYWESEIENFKHYDEEYVILPVYVPIKLQEK